jgi:hypothetical protein
MIVPNFSFIGSNLQHIINEFYDCTPSRYRVLYLLFRLVIVFYFLAISCF